METLGLQSNLSEESLIDAISIEADVEEFFCKWLRSSTRNHWQGHELFNAEQLGPMENCLMIHITFVFVGFQLDTQSF